MIDLALLVGESRDLAGDRRRFDSEGGRSYLSVEPKRQISVSSRAVISTDTLKIDSELKPAQTDRLQEDVHLVTIK